MDYETKSIFYYFLAISCILHLIFIFIFTSASLSQFLKPNLNVIDDGSKKDDYVVEVSFEKIKEEEEVDKSPEIKEEEEITPELKEEEKREIFVDTSEQITDETPQVDTEKIGEVGSIAKDMYAGQDNLNSEPRLTDEAEDLIPEPEYRTALASQQADVQIEPQINTLPRLQEEVAESEQDETVVEEENREAEMKSVSVETSEASNVREIEARDTIAVPEETAEKSVAQVREGEVTADPNDQNEEVEIEASSFDSDMIVPENIPVQGVLEEEADLEEELVEKVSTEVLEEQGEREVPQEETEPLPTRENIKLVSLPKDSMDQIAEVLQETLKESAHESAQENVENPEEQLNTISPSDTVQAPFFEDNISNAPIQGRESFNIKKHEYAPYYKHIRDKIRLFWLVQYGTDASINLVTKEYKPVVVEFKVLPSGKIVEVAISNTAGNDLLASKVQTSVQNTMLDKFPDYVNEKFINVRFNFYFF
ncbi:MAG: hypothetical protein HND49_06000 [Planctomycetes bacterium]|nr:hypothetical protein [Planctomycetota bacterium]